MNGKDAPGGEDPRLQELLDVIFRFAAGDLKARGRLADDDSALDGVMAGINILGEELEAQVAATRKSQQTLAESEALLRNVFESVQDGIILAEADTRRFLLVNAAMCRMLDYSREELLALGLVGIHPPEQVKRATTAFEQATRRGSMLVRKLPMLRKNGSVFHVDVNTAPMKVDGKACIVGVFRDTSETERADKAEDLARHDGLTNLLNHRAFVELLENEILRTLRYGGPTALLMLDIDHFKKVNDQWGHQAGDRVLSTLAQLLQQEVRGIDSVCRYGGEEIAVILPASDAAMASKTAERLRKAVEQATFDIGDGRSISITVSIGIAGCPRHADSLVPLVAAADMALYAAKQGGRNRCCTVEEAKA